MCPVTGGLAHLGGHGLCRGHHRSLLRGGEIGLGRDVSALLAGLHHLVDQDLGVADKGIGDRVMVMIMKDPIQLPSRLAHVHLEDDLTRTGASAHLCLIAQFLRLDPLAEIAMVGADTRQRLEKHTSLILVR